MVFHLKKRHTKVLMAAAAALLGAVCLFLVFYSGAWLYDNGRWSDAEYMVGRINYTYEINNELLQTANSEIELVAGVPLIGGVKINDSAALAPSDEHYQPYAEENFNEGVTLAHLVIRNKSDFDITGTYKLVFKGMFDDTSGQDIFYAVLPAGTAVDTAGKTVGGVSYKTYIKQLMNQQHADYEEMVASLKAYYAANEQLYGQDFTLNTLPDSAGNAIVVDILFWSEYDSHLPFVDASGALKPADPAAALTADFSLAIELQQNQ